MSRNVYSLDLTELAVLLKRRNDKTPEVIVTIK